MYHHVKSDSRDDCVQSQAAAVAGPAGSSGSLAMVAVHSVPSTDSDQPPLSNRGAQFTIPIENRSLIDWIAFSFKTDDPLAVIDIISLPPALFTDTSIGFSGYRKSFRFGNICVYYAGREGMGCHVELSGQGCRQYEAQFSENPWAELIQAVLANGGKFTRLDIAIDNIDGALNLPRFLTCIRDNKQIRTLFGEWRRIEKGSFQEGGTITGETIYLGSAKSEVMFRIYNKAQESGIEGNWIRFELQLRGKRSHEAAKLIPTVNEVGSIATGIINNYFAIINDDDSNTSRCTPPDLVG